MNGFDLEDVVGRANIDRIQMHGLTISVQPYKKKQETGETICDAFEVLITANSGKEKNGTDVDSVSTYNEAIVGSKEQTANIISKMIDNTIEKINAATGRIFTFKAQIGKDIDISNDLTINLLNQIQDTFDFVPAIGSINIDKDENTIEMSWLLSSIPSFLVLCTNARSSTKHNVFRLMTDTVRFTGDKHGFDVIDEDMLINTLTDNNDYREWSNHMLISLITTILNRTRGFVFRSLIWEEERVYGNNIEPVEIDTSVGQ